MQNSADHVGYRYPGVIPSQVPIRPFRHRKAGPRFVDRLADAFEQEALTDRDFVPISKLNQVVTPTSVSRELARVEYLPAYVRHRLWRRTRPLTVAPSGQLTAVGVVSNRTWKNFQKIFAILVYIRCPEKIWAFVKEEVHDGDLPLHLVRTKTPKGTVDSLRRQLDSPSDLTCLKTRDDVRDFAKHQWFVMAASFHPSGTNPVPRLKLSQSEILPFLTWSNHLQGSSNKISKITIHPDHHSFDRNQVPNNVVAVKKINHVHLHKASFEREYDILRHIRKMEHANNHIVTLLAAYEQNDHFHLLLPWAEFDLSRYWREKTPDVPSGDPKVSSWIQRQCCGLAGAVSTIHRYLTSSNTSIPREDSSAQPVARQAPGDEHDQSGDPRGLLALTGRHGDIKPEKILWYPEQNGLGVLRLSGFGNARFSSTKRKSSEQKEKVPTSSPYQSPEIMLPDGEVSSQCDVWALGCVFLEFVCWYAGGPKLLKQFEDERAFKHDSTAFCYLEPNELGTPLSVKTKEPVQMMITYLLQQAEIKTDEGMRGLLDTIQNDMLVISSSGRKSIGNIHRSLGDVLESSI